MGSCNYESSCIISQYATQGSSLKIANQRSHYKLRRYTFSVRITNVRNSLAFCVISAPVNSFKNKLDKHWDHKNFNTIGKQNYQDPGVEAELNFEFFELYHYLLIWA